jgi:hypothetical protein
MNAERRILGKQAEAGIALLISIFILLLISVVAIALIVSSGTETALAGNYRSSTGVYYAAMAGLEEARSRLLSKNPSYFRTTSPGFLPAAGTPMAVGAPVYLINPLPSETVDPWDPASTYPDKQFNQEFLSSGFSLPDPSPSTMSVWNTSPLNGLSFPGPLYKWVRINAVAETSLGVQVAPYDGHTADPTKPIFYDGTQLNVSNNGTEVLEITAFAALPNGSQKLVQYLVAPIPVTLPPFIAALSLLDSYSSGNLNFSAPPSANTGFIVSGNDQDCTGNPTGSNKIAIAGLDGIDVGRVVNGAGGYTGIPNAPASIRITNYPGLHPSPDAENIYSLGFPSAFESPSGLDVVVQTILQNIDGTIPAGSGTTQRSYLTSLLTSGAMSSTSPMTLVANGDLDLTGWNHTGYGLLLVTGTLNYDPDASWAGIVMVIGQGTITSSKSGSGEIDGAVMVAQTRDSTGTLWPGAYLHPPTFDFNFGSPAPGPTLGGKGIRYSTCWIQRAIPNSGYKILSFHEIAQ